MRLFYNKPKNTFKNQRPSNSANGFLSGRMVIALGLLTALAVLLYLGMKSYWQSGPYNVILISLDTTRKDHLSCYGYSRKTTPQIDDLAKDSIIFNKCVAVSNWTLPTHVSMLTGFHPTSHGAHFVNRDKPFVEHVEPAGRLSDKFETMAEILNEAGYRTGAILSNWWWLGKPYGLDQGFEYYDHREGKHPTVYRRAAEISVETLKWLQKKDDRPFFLLLNFMDPHIPYSPPPPYGELFRKKGAPRLKIDTWSFFLNHQFKTVLKKQALPPNVREAFVDNYDGEIAYMDEHVGRIIKWLKESKLYDNTLIIVTSDHGEAFGEHFSAGHGISMHEPEVAAAMILKLPFSTRKTFYEYGVQHVDILPTVLDVLELPKPEEIQGKSMLKEIENDLVAVQYPREMLIKYKTEFDRTQWALYRGDFKYIEYSDGKTELYDLVSDPNELQNLTDIQRKKTGLLKAALESWRKKVKPIADEIARPPELEEDTANKLRSLGYLQ